jgi:hypothetical protein
MIGVDFISNEAATHHNFFPVAASADVRRNEPGSRDQSRPGPRPRSASVAALPSGLRFHTCFPCGVTAE